MIGRVREYVEYFFWKFMQIDGWMQYLWGEYEVVR